MTVKTVSDLNSKIDDPTAIEQSEIEKWQDDAYKKLFVKYMFL